MADEQIGELALRLQRAQELDDLHLHRHVERRGRLVEQHEASDRAPWPARSRCAGAGRRRIHAGSGPWSRGRGRHRSARCDTPSAPLRMRSMSGFCTPKALLDDREHREARRERAVRVLEDDLHVLAQAAAAPSIVARRCRSPRKAIGPSVETSLQQREAERRLARAQFADDADRLPSLTVKVMPSTAFTCVRPCGA